MDNAPKLRFVSVLKQFWFPIALIGVLVFAFAADVGESDVKTFNSWVNYIIALNMFLVSLSLKTELLVKGALNLKGQTLAFFASYAFIPIASFAVAKLLFPGNEGMFAGIMIASAVPTTLVSAAVYARLAGGNDGFSVVFTIVSNVSGVVLCPVIVGIALAESVGSCDDLVEAMMLKLVLVLIIPVVLGQIGRIFIGKPADRAKPAISNLCQIMILAVVFIATASAKNKIAGDDTSPLETFLILSLGVLLIHSIAFFLCLYGGRLLKVDRPDSIAVAFSGSQKTLQVGIVIATYIMGFGCFKDNPVYAYAAFPIIFYHAVQLTVDVLFIELLKRNRI